MNIETSAQRNSSTGTLAALLCLFAAVLIPLALIGNACIVSADGGDGREFLKTGKDALEGGRYADAVRDLSVAGKEFPELGDYALLYLSDAYHNLGDHKESCAAARRLVETYPQSPLVKRARLNEIRESQENGDGDLVNLLGAFVKDYPEEDEVGMLYGSLLRQRGETAKASCVFKEIYVRAGSLSGTALEQLTPADIEASDLVERASRLMKRYEFGSAERDLRKALSMDEGKHRDEILTKLGYALFRQKEYKEASLVYERLHDSYSMARALYRAGDEKGFEAALNDLLAGNDRRAGGLLIATAADKRREKDFEGALKVYHDVLDRFPPEAEDAMWGIGWTQYRAGDYKKSSEVFSEMYAKYEDPKYLYWQARSVESGGGNADELYASLKTSGNNFYAALATVRNKEKISKPVRYTEPPFEMAAKGRRQFQRVEALLSLGMNDEAITELRWISGKIDDLPGLIYAMSKFQELGEYRRAIGLATKLPYSEKLHKFWYPLAFWDDVRNISKKYGVDPLILLSVMREESRFDVNARSVAGARGLLQIMPRTAYRLDKGLKLGIRTESQIHDAKKNIELGACYLRSLLKEFKSLAHAIAAYNAGEAIVKKWEERGGHKSADEFIEDIPYPETRNYVKKVVTSYFQYGREFSDGESEADLGVMLGEL
jgi:soluble lytic murein transglycosylase